MNASLPLELQKQVRLSEKIAAGMASLRAGKGVDGDIFLAAMDAELAEIERRESA